MRWIYLIPVFLFMNACYEPGSSSATNIRKKNAVPFQFKETIVTGKDSGMNSLSRFHRSNIADVLCQHWEPAQGFDDLPDHQLTELAIFKDSTVLENPRTQLRIGRWRVLEQNQRQVLELTFGNKKEQYFIDKAQSQQLQLTGNRSVQLVSDGLVHQNMFSDPFHPVNNRWRVAPLQPESDPAIKDRVKQCVLFWALYYRDNIRRQKEVISFQGLPRIFEWYRRGIGLPDKEEVSSSWLQCFYDREQAMKGYAILRNLIVDYEFNWPKNAPTWVHETHSVLEQMYHKL